MDKKKLFCLAGLALAVRIAVMCLGHGHDLWYFMEVADNWYAGRTPYYPPQFFPYPPLYLYFIELARILSRGSTVDMMLMAKVPQIASDIAIGWIITVYVYRKTGTQRAALAAAALYLFNPLAVYDSAFYGRIDAVCMVFVALAVLKYERPAVSAFSLALGVLTKTIPIFVYPYFLFKDRRRLLVSCAALAAVAAVLCAPILIQFRNPKEMFYSVILYNFYETPPRGLTWQYFFHRVFPQHTIMLISNVVTFTYFAFIFVFPKRDFLSFSALALASFPLFSKVVHEQYLLWSIPLLIMDSYTGRKKHALFLALVYSFTGIAYNGHFLLMKTLHIPQTLYNFALAGCILKYIYDEFRWITAKQT